MKKRTFLGRIVRRAFTINVLVGFIAYWLRLFDARFEWLLIGSASLFIMLGVAGIGLFIEYLTEDDAT